jgi:hypothetical protein
MARIIVIILTLFLVVPLGLSIFIGGASMGVGAFAMLWMFKSTSGEEKVVRKAEWDVVNVGAGSGNGRSYAKLVKRGEFDDQRSVRVRAYMSFDDVRGSDTAPVRFEDRDTYVRASAPRLARAECDAIAAAFASKCVVGRTSLEQSSAGRDLYVLEMSLLFVESADFGTVAQREPLSFLELGAVLSRNGVRRQRIDRRGQAQLRKELYRDAVTACQRQRTMTGNCAIQAVTVNTGYDGANDMVNMEARATLAVLQSQTSPSVQANAERR